MTVDAESEGKPVWARENDQRVTRVGAFIRKYRIDELPQIFNVLRGEMSFVGPRPERPGFVEELSQQIPYYRSGTSSSQELPVGRSCLTAMALPLRMLSRSFSTICTT
jgi:lipopolysaccharide/colanic/teichoic acid biosynthesis glycosyltransferase